uniref:Protein kinase domain-containing protein n=1 Tax=Panagrellus redivivus TaxID=6233 RepID=A0A7E4ZW31_PANRE
MQLPRIVLNDDSASFTSDLRDDHLSQASCESLSLFDSTTPSFSPSPVGDIPVQVDATNVSTVRHHLHDDRHVPIPDCFLHSSTITANDFQSFARIKRIDISRNRFGKVFCYVDTRSMVEMVASIIKLDTFDSWSHNSSSIEKKIKNFTEELRTVIGLRHFRIAHLYGFYKDNEKILVFNEYLPRGSVFDKARRHPIEEKCALKYFLQACEALQFIHSQNLSHGNIKATNLLITLSDDIKLTDFAVSHDSEADDFDDIRSVEVTNYRMKLLHASPEDVRRFQNPMKPLPPSDIWALGCVLVNMLTQAPPYFEVLKTKGDQEVYKIIVDNYVKPDDQRLQYTSNVLIKDASDATKKLFDYIMVDDQSGRPTAEEILEHPTISKTKAQLKNYSIFGKCIPSIKPVPTQQRNGQARKSKISSAVKKPSVVKNDHKEEPAENENRPSVTPFKFFLRFFGFRILIFLLLMIKWSLMVFGAALVLSVIVMAIFMSISIIYQVIKTACQCELNEGFSVQIAIILLPILILLSTLCCNNAWENYHKMMHLGSLAKNRFFVDDPNDDVIIWGVRVMRGARRRQKRSAFSKDDGSDDKNPAEKGNILNTIRDLA